MAHGNAAGLDDRRVGRNGFRGGGKSGALRQNLDFLCLRPETLEAINSGYEPRGIADHSHGAYGNWPKTGGQWVEYRWSKPICTAQTAVYWWQDRQGVKLPVSSRLLYWNGSDYIPVPGATEVGVKGGVENTASFPELTTDRLRLEFTGNGTFSTGILQWKVIDSGKSPKFAPFVDAGSARVVVLPSTAKLEGRLRGTVQSAAWSKASGPGPVVFEDAAGAKATAVFSQPGRYVLCLTASNFGESATAQTTVEVESGVPETHLDPVFTTRYSLDSPLWSDRARQLIVHWVPHLIDELSQTGSEAGRH